MQLDIAVNISSPVLERKLEGMLKALLEQGELIMSSIADFAAKQNAFNTEIGADLDAIQANLKALNTLITTLQNSPGTITAEDQATLDQLQAAGATLQSQADAVAGKTPPAPPAA